MPASTRTSRVKTAPSRVTTEGVTTKGVTTEGTAAEPVPVPVPVPAPTPGTPNLNGQERVSFLARIQQIQAEALGAEPPADLTRAYALLNEVLPLAGLVLFPGQVTVTEVSHTTVKAEATLIIAEVGSGEQTTVHGAGYGASHTDDAANRAVTNAVLQAICNLLMIPPPVGTDTARAYFTPPPAPPVQAAQAANPSPAPNGPATDKQRNALLALARERWGDTGPLEAFLRCPLDSLTARTASSAIDRLRALPPGAISPGALPPEDGGNSKASLADSPPQAPPRAVPLPRVQSQKWGQVTKTAEKNGWGMDGNKFNPKKLLEALRAEGFTEDMITDANIGVVIDLLHNHYAASADQS